MESAIAAENLTKIFGKRKALDNISFTLEKGEVVGFLGPNGAGKSTTLRIISGLMESNEGTVYVGGISVALNPNKVKELIGYMPENNPLPEELSVKEYLYYRASLKKVPARNQKTQVEDVLNRCDLAKTASNRIIRNLSKGYKQRIGIADCLLGNPQIIIMDEPTIGLDPHQIISLRELINSLRGQLTILVSSHILPEIEASCDKVIIMNQGHIVAMGSPTKLKTTFSEKRRFKLTLNLSQEKLTEELLKLPHSLEIITQETTHYSKKPSYIIEAATDQAIEENLIQHFKEPIFGLTELTTIEPSLETIFLTATQKAWKKESN